MLKKVMIAAVASGFAGAALTAAPAPAQATFLCKENVRYEPGSFCARHLERMAGLEARWDAFWNKKDKRLFKKRHHARKQEERAPRQPRRPIK